MPYSATNIPLPSLAIMLSVESADPGSMRRFFTNYEPVAAVEAEKEKRLIALVEKFYWVQFEHFLPTNTRTYDYSPNRTTQIGEMTFIYDVKSWPDYSAMQLEDPQSDGAAVERLLAKHGLSFPKQAARVRMFHLPTPDRRSELMIIYGESLAENSKVPVRENGVELDKESPEAATVFLEHARGDLKIHLR